MGELSNDKILEAVEVYSCIYEHKLQPYPNQSIFSFLETEVCLYWDSILGPSLQRSMYCNWQGYIYTCNSELALYWENSMNCWSILMYLLHDEVLMPVAKWMSLWWIQQSLAMNQSLLIICLQRLQLSWKLTDSDFLVVCMYKRQWQFCTYIYIYICLRLYDNISSVLVYLKTCDYVLVPWVPISTSLSLVRFHKSTFWKKVHWSKAHKR